MRGGVTRGASRRMLEKNEQVGLEGGETGKERRETFGLERRKDGFVCIEKI